MIYTSGLLSGYERVCETYPRGVEVGSPLGWCSRWAALVMPAATGSVTGLLPIPMAPLVWGWLSGKSLSSPGPGTDRFCLLAGQHLGRGAQSWEMCPCPTQPSAREQQSRPPCRAAFKRSLNPKQLPRVPRTAFSPELSSQHGETASVHQQDADSS